MGNRAQSIVEPRRLFNGIASAYEAPAVLFSWGQYRRWHRFLVACLNIGPKSQVLDVCTGTGLVAMDIAQRDGRRIVGLDLSDGMLAVARAKVQRHGAHGVSLVRGRAERLPFPDASFDTVTFTYLLRYVDDPAAVLQELARVLRPGGQLASLEFYVPPNPLIRLLWMAHTRIAMPMGTGLLSSGWREVGSFLGPSISSFYKRHSLENLRSLWAMAGVKPAHTKLLSLGGAVVMWGTKESANA